MLYVKVLKYIDDIIIFSKTEEEHLLILEEVFRRLSINGITVNPKKMKLLWPEVSYLGMIISHNSYKVDPSRVEKIHNYPRPKNAKEVSRFIGFCSYFSKSIPEYGKIAAPINALRKVRTKFIWSSECERSFVNS